MEASALKSLTVSSKHAVIDFRLFDALSSRREFTSSCERGVWKLMELSSSVYVSEPIVTRPDGSKPCFEFGDGVLTGEHAKSEAHMTSDRNMQISFVFGMIFPPFMDL